MRAGEDQGCRRPGLKRHSTLLKTRTPCVWRLLLCTCRRKAGMSSERRKENTIKEECAAKIPGKPRGLYYSLFLKRREEIKFER